MQASHGTSVSYSEVDYLSEGPLPTAEHSQGILYVPHSLYVHCQIWQHSIHLFLVDTYQVNSQKHRNVILQM